MIDDYSDLKNKETNHLIKKLKKCPSCLNDMIVIKINGQSWKGCKNCYNFVKVR